VRLFPLRSASELGGLRARADDPEVRRRAAEFVAAVRSGGVERLRALAQELDGLTPDAPLLLGPAVLAAAERALAPEDRAVLARTARRIEAFAEAQRAALGALRLPIPGGHAELAYMPVERAGCYAPGGRHPLPSSVLMTALTARAAGVAEVWLASPRPAPVTLAAAHLAGVCGVLAAGGAQAIAALAFGVEGLPPCDVVVGPGNRYVTEAKRLVAGEVGIDLFAGPSELVVLADDAAEPRLVAADLLAQAEHDPDALPVLVTIAPALVEAVERELARALATLPTAATARLALARGGVFLARDLEQACAWVDALAPEHLELALRVPAAARARLKHHGALFVAPACEVLGDYGAGPNHVLPTGGSARASGGLSVLTFLRARTTLSLEAPGEARELCADAARLARLEGLEAHARAAEARFA
jgi:phosphoribosyl-ATP pyrophosphohydrolase/phosphoribosyl-AMP cyclohydrolase/histidinol dehydrogenase